MYTHKYTNVSDEEEDIRKAIIKRMRSLKPGQSLDISNLKFSDDPQKPQVIGFKIIPTPDSNYRGKLHGICGYPKLFLQLDNYNYYNNLFNPVTGINPFQTKSGCSKS